MSFEPPGPPPYAPPPGPPVAYGAPGAVDVLVADPGKRSHRWRWIAAAVVVVVLVATVAGAALAVRWWRGTAPALAAFLPPDVTTVAVVDLDPSGGQKVDAVRLLTRLPRGVLDGATDAQQAGSSLAADVLTDVVDVPTETIGATTGAWFGGQLAVATRDPFAALGSSGQLSDPDVGTDQALQLVVMTVKDVPAFEAAWAQWGSQGRAAAAAYVVRDGVVVVGNGALAGLPTSESGSVAATEAFTASAGVRDGALAWVWATAGEATAYPAPGGKQTVAVGLRVRSDGLELAATVRGFTPRVEAGAPPVATAPDVAAAVSIAPMASALLSASDAYDWGLDPSDGQVGSLLELLGGSISAAAPVSADGTVGLALDLLGGGAGVAALRADLEAAAEELGEEAGVDIGGLDPGELLDGLQVEGDDASVRYQVPAGTSAIGTSGSAAVPDSAAAVQVYVHVPTLLRTSGVRDSLPSDDDTDTLLDAVETVGVSIAMPEDGRADVAVRVLLRP